MEASRGCTGCISPAIAKENTILAFAADGSPDIGQLKNVFDMELGTTVQFKTRQGSTDVVYHIAKIEGQTVTSSTKTAARR